VRRGPGRKYISEVGDPDPGYAGKVEMRSRRALENVETSLGAGGGGAQRLSNPVGTAGPASGKRSGGFGSRGFQRDWPSASAAPGRGPGADYQQPGGGGAFGRAVPGAPGVAIPNGTPTRATGPFRQQVVAKTSSAGGRPPAAAWPAGPDPSCFRSDGRIIAPENREQQPPVAHLCHALRHGH